MPQPISEKQLAANRANALKSTGPRTAEGKARSSRNARKHGFAAISVTALTPEDLDEIARLKADLVAVYRPANTQELFALDRAAQAQQAILRAARLEASLFNACLEESPRGRSGNHSLGEGFERMAMQSNAFTLFLRYQAQAERNYRRAMEEFEYLKAQRDVLPNQPILEAQPAENKSNSSESYILVSEHERWPIASPAGHCKPSLLESAAFTAPTQGRTAEVAAAA